MKNALLGFLILFFASGGPVFAQQPEELAKVESLIQSKEFDKALFQVNQFIAQKPSRFILSQAYYQLSEIYLGLKNTEKAIYYNQQSLDIRKNLRYEFLADNYLLFGLIEMERNNNDKALNYFYKAAELPFETIEFGGLLYAYIAQVHYRKGEIKEVVKNYGVAMGALRTAFEESSELDLNHYRIRGHRLFYDNFFIGYL